MSPRKSRTGDSTSFKSTPPLLIAQSRASRRFRRFRPLFARTLVIWHLHAGWFDGNPAHLKPAPAAELAAELASLAGGADKLAHRAAILAQGGRTRLAAHLAELAAAASPQNGAIQATRASVYERCGEAETSLIGKALFAVYQREAKAKSTF
jgi:alkyl sulfatase BDS1-like metallo-beta-lactamase superfamily hydrolase